jgi:hypothetical protein
VDLYEIIRQRDERGSIVLTSNRDVDDWPPLFVDRSWPPPPWTGFGTQDLASTEPQLVGGPLAAPSRLVKPQNPGEIFRCLHIATHPAPGKPA